ncbi:hypothetical protein FHX37_0996 [Haloactinospora alba]|uniref:PE-PGRS family protein n=1 Tax=Haloactinospora alba TaxID=405555 RepID=A0A543NGX3_9ACTN|nr:hypothetical protein [Haloactinospora alba]TQN31106.1 hypothetical protein FHX37_0996 [Haloactinospora alba]
MRFRLKGDEYRIDRAEVEARMEGRTPEPLHEHWVEVNGCRWPPKQVLHEVLHVSRADFTTHTALRHLDRLGFATSVSAVAAEDAFAAPAEALRTLIAFTGSGTLTQDIARLEGRLQGVDRNTAEDVGLASALSEDLLQAALLIRQHAGRISDIIHAATITQVLPLILDEAERVTVRPSLGAGNDPSRTFDVETDHRVAEFKVAVWKGRDAMRKRGVFQDLVHLALDETDRRAQLYVVGQQPIHFLRSSTTSADWGLSRASPHLRQKFDERFGSRQVRVCDFANGPAANVELIDLGDLLPVFRERATDGTEV